MTRAVTTCTEGDSVDELMEMMTQGRFRHVPVIDERERLIGIISIGDVVKSRIEETVREGRRCANTSAPPASNLSLRGP